MPQTAATLKIYSKLEAPYSNKGSKALHMEIIWEILTMGIRDRKSVV